MDKASTCTTNPIATSDYLRQHRSEGPSSDAFTPNYQAGKDSKSLDRMSVVESASQQSELEQPQLSKHGNAQHISTAVDSHFQQSDRPMETSTVDKQESGSPRLILTEAIHPDKYKMKQKRRGATAVGIVGGAVVGTMVFPVLGTAIGGAAAGYACNKFSKHSERRAQRAWEQYSFQQQALESHTVNAVLV